MRAEEEGRPPWWVLSKTKLNRSSMMWALPGLLQVSQCPLSTRTACGAQPSREDRGDDITRGSEKDGRGTHEGILGEHVEGSSERGVQGGEHKRKYMDGSTAGSP